MIESINVVIDDVFIEEAIVEDSDELDHSSVDPTTITELKEKSIPEPPHSPEGLDTTNKAQSPGTNPKLLGNHHLELSLIILRSILREI